ncbi:MAG TPA: ThuA domain-containing protein, partial [Pirellulales bacterium]|nr:ThuA domain-containing protein [Pirellulales bacterium]
MSYSLPSPKRFLGAPVVPGRHALLALAIAGLSTFCSRASMAAPWPHHEENAPGVHVIGFADRFHSANCGFFVAEDETWLVDLPRGIPVQQYLADVKKVSGHAPAVLLLTHAMSDDAKLVGELREHGVKRVYLSPGTYKFLFAASSSEDTEATAPKPGFEIVARRQTLGGSKIEFLPRDDTATAGAAAVFLPASKVLFAGPLVYHGPRVPLPGRDTNAWREALEEVAAMKAARVVPGFGSWDGAELIDRQQRFLNELRRQVGYFIAQGQPRADLQRVVRLVPDYLVWMPYDTPVAEDVEHVYDELTVPYAPFNGKPPQPNDERPHALVLIGDQPHEPGHIEAGLRPIFAATHVVPHFAVDVNALSAENLAHVQLLVILRDGLMRPQAPDQPDYVWMTKEQEQAVVDFVHRGGGFLNLHNSMGLYPEDGPYLRLVGGRYIGHGPLERFRVEVVDRDHPVTRGVEDFSVADEQHTPPYDDKRVHLLLRNRSDNGETAAAGWVYEPGKGRLCHL